jgi:hypothetical protein
MIWRPWRRVDQADSFEGRQAFLRASGRRRGRISRALSRRVSRGAPKSRAPAILLVDEHATFKFIHEADVLIASVFFLDRLCRATLSLAAAASAQGAVVVFEPSSKAATKLMTEAVTLANIVKYAGDGGANPRRARPAIPAPARESGVELDIARRRTCTTSRRHLRFGRLVHSRFTRTAGGQRPRRLAANKRERGAGRASLWSGPRGLELRLWRRARRDVLYRAFRAGRPNQSAVEGRV